ncbi:MAG: putative toxin-antitoxin system toxin component, PIN family [Candidatus Acididesulfobacter diazotrophicus]|jgi:putative PIN family toxin of toxin-antitoxin system|uniref:Putative toxin-antitoxin system toxin component, PIN family n=1 Tax=Candidatus Acididesulfobacter diazotrophicus TaxID=2597226 RepID=A0A519BLI4_9DELT|nr:MAG: putative toxin-antitoxin system toxin component, PIN family [Candidatus Acididesulfobacter diazotrophicus]
MKVVLDSNVIIAAFSARGLCLELFENCILNQQIIISEFILREVEENLIKKIKLPQEIVSEIIEYLRNTFSLVEPGFIDSNICRDKNDLKIIGTAIAGNAQIIITGDKDLLILKQYKKIKIAAPRDFWNNYYNV